MASILQVKNLRVSFRTTSGIVKAVRNVSFNLERGKTMAIVGESGSGKSVTSKAILGILAGNSIVESGEILYDGKDLLKISEDEMHHLRGDKISMIFQDPLSSLNPIVKIGPQITEAMLLKNKANKREAKRDLKVYLKKLNDGMVKAGVPASEAQSQCVKKKKYEDTILPNIEKAMRHVDSETIIKKKDLLPKLEKAEAYFAGDFTKAEAVKYIKELDAEVKQTIDTLEVFKDNAIHTFGTSMNSGVEKYFYYMDKNPKEEKRFAKQTAKREALIARGRRVDWKVVPKNIVSTDIIKEELVATVANLRKHYLEQIATQDSTDYSAKAKDVVAFMEDKVYRTTYTVTKAMARDKAIQLMKEVGIPEPERRFKQYPFEFSGGMRQRIVIAIALAADPEILICDEPTTALDVTIQAQILELINNLKRERHLSIIFITHDLGVVANMADEIAVMYAGKIIEYGTAEEIFYEPKHPYTWALLSSMPDLDTKEKLEAIPGTPPNMIYPPVGDAFAERNKYAMQIDFEKEPPKFKVSDTHWAATWLLHPDAPKVEMPAIIKDRIERMNKANGGEA